MSDSFIAKAVRPGATALPEFPEGVVPTRVVAAVIRRGDGRLLITQRKAEDVLGGLWEFPGGKVEEGEPSEAALVRELQEELAVEAEVGARVLLTKHHYEDSNKHLALEFFETRIVAGEPQCVEVADLRWVTPDELGAYEFPAADAALIELLRQG
jgi:8-oxo-dGTP diphosphatase